MVAWTAVGVLSPGLYLLTSIGLNITKHTRYYPVSTIAGAGCNVGLNFVLIPRFGILGAAWANAAAYAVQAAVAYRFSQRFYPIAYEARTDGARRGSPARSPTLRRARAFPPMRPLAGVLAARYDGGRR